MIFSLGDTEKNLVLPETTDFDIICFFRVNHAIHADEKLWWKTLTGSLRGKRSVLILESEVSSFPAMDKTQRWQLGDNWCWLTPRSLSVISNGYSNSSMNIRELKSFLTNYKP
ncbi:hypothetical protein [Peredibacter starrii]|uniref:Uncharacterized protein n=1 Tax=Peredibacter starrii TaxID=28202 RepID=A0AAX4HQL4_9BACT|nr:hypothetical protein [Peredibacter starrii]WPU65495.1 hypothetical protein SOO65_01920 [Peredibacter starrii]